MRFTKHDLLFLLGSASGGSILGPALYYVLVPHESVLAFALLGIASLITIFAFYKRWPSQFACYGRMFFHTAGGIFTVAYGLTWTNKAASIILLSLLASFSILAALDRIGFKTTFSGGRFLLGQEEQVSSHYISGVAWLSSALILLSLLDAAIAYASILICSLGDTASGLVSRGSKTIGIGKGRDRMWLCLSAFFISSFPFAALFVKPILAALGTFAAAVVERVRIPLDNNLTVPIAAAAAITTVTNIILI